jgi:hypothetical protein
MSTINTTTPRAKEMFGIIEKYLTSGLRQKEFCRQENIAYSTFHWWLAQYRRVNGKNKIQQKQFIPIKLKTSPTNGLPHCRIEYPNGVVLHLTGQYDPQFITTLISAL